MGKTSCNFEGANLQDNKPHGAKTSKGRPSGGGMMWERRWMRAGVEEGERLSEEAQRERGDSGGEGLQGKRDGEGMFGEVAANFLFGCSCDIFRTTYSH